MNTAQTDRMGDGKFSEIADGFARVFGSERGHAPGYEPPAPAGPTTVDRARALTDWINCEHVVVTDPAQRPHQFARAAALGLSIDFVETAPWHESTLYADPDRAVMAVVYDSASQTPVGQIELIGSRANLLLYDKRFPRRER